jgi:hypothetical protein
MKKIFDTDRRIRLGIWGCGRGKNFVNSARLLNIDVVAGCDIHEEIRERFKQDVPEAFCTADEKEFLAYDMDVILVATYLPDHAKHTIMALEAGKHVLCEVTPFQTPADAVKVIEAVEKSGKIYNILENYPFTQQNMYMQQMYEKGFFGDFVYGEFDYLHECRTLTYGYNTYPVSIPVSPGYAVHNWRSYLNYHHYCTHSLGPAMYITNLRPVSVSAVKDEVCMPGLLDGIRAATACPSMIKMSNGGLVRNLMGSTTNDFHMGMRFWGTKAGAQHMRDEFQLRIGGTGEGYLMNVKPELTELQKLAFESGHGGGDFWELYFFAREFLYGEKAFWNVYRAADVTLAGIMAIRSEKRNGQSIEIPDLRDKANRELYRNDHESGAIEFDTSDIFPAGHDKTLTDNFTRLMTEVYPICMDGGLNRFHAVFDGIEIYDQIDGDAGKLLIRNKANQLVKEMPKLAENCQMLKKIMEAYPDSIPGRTIAKVLDTPRLEKLLNADATIAELQKWQTEVC